MPNKNWDYSILWLPCFSVLDFQNITCLKFCKTSCRWEKCLKRSWRERDTRGGYSCMVRCSNTLRNFFPPSPSRSRLELSSLASEWKKNLHYCMCEFSFNFSFSCPTLSLSPYTVSLMHVSHFLSHTIKLLLHITLYLYCINQNVIWTSTNKHPFTYSFNCFPNILTNVYVYSSLIQRFWLINCFKNEFG